MNINDYNGDYVVRTGKKDDNITVKVNADNVEIKDNVTHESSTLNKPKKVSLLTEGGNDVINVNLPPGKAKGLPKIDIFPGDGNDFVMGEGRCVKVYKEKGDLVLPSGDRKTLEKNVDKIKEFNNSIKEEESTLHKAKRSGVYLVGRDSKLPSAAGVYDSAKYLKGGEVIKALDRLSASRQEFSITPEQIADIKSKVQPGDIMLRFQKGYPIDKLTVGHWQHAGIYEADGNVVDSMGVGVDRRPIEKFLEADQVIVLRMKGKKPEDIDKALEYALTQVGKGYNIEFDNTTKEQYCSGLVKNALEYAGVIPIDFFGQKIVKPDMLQTLPGLEVVWNNRPDEKAK